MICPNCGKGNPDDSYYCRECGWSLKQLGAEVRQEPKKEEKTYPFKSKTTAYVLCILFGWLGVHRFYVGKIGTGILYALTLGVFGVGWFLDLFNLFCGAFRDKNNFPLM